MCDPAKILGEPEDSLTRPEIALQLKLARRGRRGTDPVQQPVCGAGFSGLLRAQGGQRQSRSETLSEFSGCVRRRAGAVLAVQLGEFRAAQPALLGAHSFVRARGSDSEALPGGNFGSRLFRQQALAEAFARRPRRYARVWAAVAWDERNDALRRSLRGAGIPDFAATGRRCSRARRGLRRGRTSSGYPTCAGTTAISAGASGATG